MFHYISTKITSLELVNVYIDRINEIQPLVNCVVKTCFEEAIEVGWGE